MTSHIELYIWMLGIIACIGGVASRVNIPSPLLLVITGMLLSFLPDLPDLRLDPTLVLNIFLPLLVYAGSRFTSWPEVKGNIRAISLLSIGHVIFITVLVAVTAHYLIPGLPWPIAFILGAVISPPDDVAIFAIADKIHVPQRLLVILFGESLLNDATALTLFRFGLIALASSQFSAGDAAIAFIAVIIGEIAYGMLLGHAIGQLRLRIQDPMLQIVVSLLTPFLAYFPAVRLGGCGVLATVVTSVVLSHRYLERFSPDVRLFSQAVWDSLSFVLQSILFLLVGLNFQSIISGITTIPMKQLILLGSVMTLVVIVGRFVWVYPATYLPRLLIPSLRRRDPYPPWQFPFFISWAGMRGGISLAAAMAIPHLTLQLDGVDLRELIIFLTFCVIIATLILQGVSLPWIIQALGLSQIGKHEKTQERLSIIAAKLEMIKTALAWLRQSEQEADDEVRREEIKLQVLAYQAHQLRLEESLCQHEDNYLPDQSKRQLATLAVSTSILEIEREVLLRLWHEGKISARIRNRLMQQLDHVAGRLAL